MQDKSDDISTSEGLARQDIPRQVMLLANALSRVHGEVVIRREGHGLHLYMASPEALEQDGLKELQSKHLTVNADRYLGLGQWTNRVGTYNKELSAVCHKYGTKYTVEQLKSLPPLEKRGIKNVKRTVFNSAVDREKYLVDDGKGNMIPNHPGHTLPINELPDDHPAVEYLLNRGYDPEALYRQFRCAFCHMETPENPDIKLYYRRLPGGFKDTPQGRLIFYIDVKGIQEGWQARILDKIEGDQKFHWHPYQNRWELTHVRVNGIWTLRPDYKKEPYAWKPSKYRTGNGTERSRVVLGYDAAVEWSNKSSGTPWACLMEGPLDAGRMGPPGLAFLGKYLNEEQGKLIARKFRKVLFIADADASGRESKKSIYRALADKVELVEVPLPPEYKDVGEMSDTTTAWRLIAKYI